MTTCRQFLYLLLLLVFHYHVTTAQVNNSVFDNLLTEWETHKLYVNSITQDNNGFIWFGTFEGLMRYDGISYQSYLPANDNKRSVSDKLVNTLFIDSKKNLWVGTRNGLNRYNYLHNDFDRFLYEPDSNSINNNDINAISEDAEGNLWIGSLNGGLTKIITTKTNGVESFRFIRCIANDLDSTALSNNTVFAICFDHSGNGWIATQNGLNLIDRKNSSSEKISFRHLKNDPRNEGSIAVDEVYKIFCDRNNNIWLNSKFGMLDLVTAADITSGNFHFHHLFPELSMVTRGALKSSSTFFIDRNDRCWLGTFEDGLYRFTLSGDHHIENLIHFYNNPANSRSLQDNAIWSVFQSSDQTIWIGTGSGVSRWNPMQEKFSIVNAHDNSFDTFGVTGIAEDIDGTVWIAPGSDTLTAILPTGSLKKIALADIHQKGNLFPYINTLFISGYGDVYAGTSAGLFILTNDEKKKFLSSGHDRPATKHLLQSDADVNSLLSNTVNTIAEDRDHQIWIGTGMGLNVYDPQTEKCIRVRWNKLKEEIDPAYIIRHVKVDSDGNVWMATDNGLFEVQRITHSIRAYQKKDGLPDIRISFILQSHRDHLLWLGTGQGLVSFQPDSGSFKIYPLLADRAFNIMAMLEDHNGNLWLSTDHGIFNFNPANSRTTIFTSKNGLNSNHFNASAAFTGATGIFYFGGEKGYQSFYPDSIDINRIKPPVVITDFKLFNQSILHSNNIEHPDQFLQSKRLELNYNQNFFSIDFAALNFINSAENKYRYRLADVDKDWVDAGNRRTATYTDISPGRYEFKVQGSNNDGIWNDEGATLFIVIASPWWQTWWFYTLAAMAFASILYLIYQYRINQIKKLFSLRSKIARDLHDDIGSTLSSISLMSQLAKDGSDGNNKEQELFETISSASREAMELMSVIVWSVNPNNDKLSNILIRMREYASDILEASNIDMKIILDEEVRDAIIPMEKRKDFYLIFKEAVNNVAKYSKANCTTIHLFKEAGKMVMLIEDDGRGFEQEKLRSGNGLMNMSDRAKFIGGMLHLHSSPGKGTSVRLEMPLA